MKRLVLLLACLTLPGVAAWAASGVASGATSGAASGAAIGAASGAASGATSGPAGAADSAVAGKAAIKLDIGTPPVAITRHSLAQRSSRLVRFYEVGVIGLASDGLVYLRDASKLSLVQRQIAEKLIDAENADRNTLVFAIADGNGHREAQAEVRALLVERWQSQFKSGWWLRDAAGTWQRKP